MTNSSNNKPVYDLEERTFLFAKNIRASLKNLKKDMYNQDDIRQLIRSSGSIGANYIEANESLSKKDFIHRIKISRKEAKESIYWIKLLLAFCNNEEKKGLEELRQEATELKKILSSIIEKSKKI